MMFDTGGEQLSATAKARVRKGTLLKADAFHRMLKCSDVSEVTRVLKSTYYASYLPADVESLHRDKLELLLMSAINSEVQSFFPSLGHKRHAFLKLWLERRDIQLIKGRIWEIYIGKTDANVKAKVVNEDYKDLSLLDSSLINRRKLLSSNSMSEIIASIKNEKLVAALEESLKRTGKKINETIMIGFALDAFNNNRIFNAANSFSGKEREGLLSLCGVYVDLVSIISIYRGKKYFNMSEEVALSMIHMHYRVNFDKLKAIASLPHERMWEPLAGTLYASLLPRDENESDDISSVAGITRRMRSIQRESALKTFASGGAGIHFIIAYLVLRELEILSLSATIEVVRYNYDRGKVEKLLALSTKY